MSTNTATSKTLRLDQTEEWDNLLVGGLGLENFTGGLSETEEDESKNHWSLRALALGRPIRLSEESRINPLTNERGTVMVKRSARTQPSWYSLKHYPFRMLRTSVRFRDIRIALLNAGLHRYKMVQDENGYYVGCRDWV